MKKTLAIALVVMFVCSLAVPALAQGLNHSISAQIEGNINWKSQAGHLCNTGAEQKKTVMGSAEIFEMERSVVMIEGRLTVADMNDFVAGDTGLTVTSVIELCAPPKMEFTTTKYVPIAGTVVVDPFFDVGVYAYIIDNPDIGVFDEIKITEVEVDGSFRTRFFFTNPGGETSTQEIIALLELYDSDGNLKKSEEERRDRTIDPDRTFRRGIWIDLPIATQFHEGIAEAGDYFLFTAKAGSNEETWRVNVLEDASGGMGSIQGFVGAVGSEPFPIAGATVTATSNPSAVGPFKATTDEDGIYSMDVPVGTYTVKVNALGYDEKIKTGVEVTDIGFKRVDFTLQGSPSGTIEIDPVFDTDNFIRLVIDFENTPLCYVKLSAYDGDAEQSSVILDDVGGNLTTNFTDPDNWFVAGYRIVAELYDEPDGIHLDTDETVVIGVVDGDHSSASFEDNTDGTGTYTFTVLSKDNIAINGLTMDDITTENLSNDSEVKLSQKYNANQSISSFTDDGGGTYSFIWGTGSNIDRTERVRANGVIIEESLDVQITN